MPARLQFWLFVFLLIFLGFCGGMFTGSLFVPPGSGFTGPATAFWYGIGGLLAGLIAGISLARSLKQPGFRIALIIAVILSLFMTSWIIYRVKSLKDQRTDSAINFERYVNTHEIGHLFGIGGHDDKALCCSVFITHSPDNIISVI
jgi:hypothetical protein